MIKHAISLLSVILFFVTATGAEPVIISHNVSLAPVVDGVVDSAIWKEIAPIKVVDTVTEKTVAIKSVHTSDRIFFLVQFPDQNESREHRSMLWDEASGVYVNGPRREDVFVFKWDLYGTGTNLTLSENRPYKADIWYWKAMRTDPMGYADDKIQIYSTRKTDSSKIMMSKSGRPYFLSRNGDSGTAAYTTVLNLKPGFKTVNKYKNQKPSGSRSDVQAKGCWTDNNWTIEFSRKLDTGHDDDIPFEVGKSYRFGISLLEIAGRDPEVNSDVPLFGSGKISEIITLKIKH